ncbi:MAG: hypothetical protein PHZ19_04655, partial [Candidatus Thermoplasmatota archaeon]|nr:hypothetical protein [Candidatus Thermoplasmatota archaeon]
GETGAVGSGGYEPFFIDVNTPARYIRFHCPGSGYVDGSNGTIHLQEEQEPVPENGNGKFRINLPVLLLITAAGLGTLIILVRKKK